MAIKVSEDVIKRIRTLGMARSLKEANSPGASAEFKEGVRRFYPKAVYGPKTKAAAESVDRTTASPPSPSPVAKSSSRAASLVSNVSTMRPAIERRISTPAKGINVAVKGSANTRKPGRSQRDNLLGRKTKSKAIDTFSAEQKRKKRMALAQRPRSGKRY